MIPRTVVSLVLAAGAALASSRAAGAQTRTRWPGPPFTEGFYGAHVGGAPRLAVAAGVRRGQVVRRDVYEGYGLLAEAGLGGGKVVASLLGARGYETWMQLRAVGLHTWGRPREVAAGQSYAGGEIRYTRWPICVGFGVYIRVAGDAPDGARFSAATIGLGF
jgi:hypothetical protein